MERRKLDKFIGLPYSARFDCADFAMRVLHEVFGISRTSLPGHRPRGKHVEGEMASAAAKYAERVDLPFDGAVVLMYDFGDVGSPSHVGIYVECGGVPYVLHSAERLGGSAMTPMRKLNSMGLRFEGFYKWQQG